MSLFIPEQVSERLEGAEKPSHSRVTAQGVPKSTGATAEGGRDEPNASRTPVRLYKKLLISTNLVQITQPPENKEKSR
jgi:hypothetical protein